MKTITLDILNNRALDLLKDLEQLNLIRLRRDKEDTADISKVVKYKGKMTRQPIEEVDKQLKELRSAWD